MGTTIISFILNSLEIEIFISFVIFNVSLRFISGFILILIHASTVWPSGLRFMSSVLKLKFFLIYSII